MFLRVQPYSQLIFLAIDGRMSNALQTYEAEKREFIYFYVQLAVQVGSFCIGYLLTKASREQLALEQADPLAEE